ncbi:MAG: pyridoxal phosphate-dependent aminotransferase [Prevotella sp.]|nr:pyridoxal phosphate-dependent aminotransferase [Prevotella sp.]
MKYDFDEIIERRGTGCVKWDESSFPEVIPLWVADMDFRAAPAIRQAVSRRAEHGVFGYTLVGDEYYEAITSWFHRRHGWDIRREEILYTTGVVPAMAVALKALTMAGEKVLMLSPDYNCFFSSVRNSGCEVLESVLRRVAHSSLITDHSSLITDHSSLSFEVDWQDFEAKCADEKTTVFLLCNPHNPTGRVWTREELARMNDICLKHGVKVVSDEIHCELTMPGHTFQPFAAVSEECRMNCVTLNSPSKSFNTAGLQTANIICARPEWRRRLDRAININEVCDVNPFGPVALVAAYNECEDWIDELNQYLWGNYTALCDFAARHLPQWQVCALEGTYLPWVDITATGMTSVQYADRLMRRARVWVNPGTMYGPQSGEGYIRLNIACPRSVLMEALERISGIED